MMKKNKGVINIACGMTAFIVALTFITSVKADWVTAWGSPQFGNPFTNNGETGDFRLREGWGCCNNPTNQDDQAVIAFVARHIVEKGGNFCPLMISVGSSSSSRYLLWNEAVNPTLCRWLCEPGFEGAECKTPTSDAAACDTTSLAKADLTGGETYSGTNAIAMVRQTASVALGHFGRRTYQRFQYQIILGATGFVANGHGITAAPIIVGATGDHPITTWLKSQRGSSTEKTLCAAGFSGPNCAISSSKCGQDFWCSGWTEFESAQHEKVPVGNCLQFRCTSGKVFTSATDRMCKTCTAGFKTGIGQDGLCVECVKGQYYDSLTSACKPAKGYAKNIMQYGKSSVAAVADQCWTKESPDEYKACLNQ
jgi:hypothetical protein